jgi:hypothetical protein
MKGSDEDQFTDDQRQRYYNIKGYPSRNHVAPAMDYRCDRKDTAEPDQCFAAKQVGTLFAVQEGGSNHSFQRSS